jgi:hypothetical protein
MDCRTCEPTLIDLVHDELATDAAAEARAHLGECASCRASFERLVAGRALASRLELERPPQPVGARLLQLAESRAAELRAEAAPKSPPTPARALFDFLARFAMGRQVGMATIMLLIVALGVWSLPRLRRDPVGSGAVVDAETEGEAAPSPGVVPADRLDLEVDPRARRIRSADGQQILAPSNVPTPVTAAAAGAPEPAVEETASVGKDGTDPLARLDDVDDLFEAKKEGAPSGGGSREQPKGDDQTLGDSDTLGRARGEAESEASARVSSAAGPQAFPASQAATPEEQLGDLAAARSAAPEPAQQLRQKAKRASEAPQRSQASAEGSGQSAPAPSPAPPPQDLLEDAYRSREADPSQTSASLLEVARSVARTRGCAAALPSYQRVVTAAPGGTAAGTALIEMAQCKRTLGQLAEAQRLLERAAAVPTTRDRARALMGPVRTEQAPAAPAASPTSAPAAPTYRR